MNGDTKANVKIHYWLDCKCMWLCYIAITIQYIFNCLFVTLLLFYMCNNFKDLDCLHTVNFFGWQEGDLKYTLYGVLVHLGWTTHSGHYYSYVRTSSGMWYSLDDSRVWLMKICYKLMELKIFRVCLIDENTILRFICDCFSKFTTVELLCSFVLSIDVACNHDT